MGVPLVRAAVVAPHEAGPVRVLVCGSRDWTALDPIRARLNLVPEVATIVHGDCPSGADRLADVAARMLGHEVEPHPANWKLGRKAGPIRNNEMLDSGIDLVLAFHLDGSRGTQHTIDGARRRGIPVEVHTA